MSILYFVIAFFSTTLGAVTGMGGGILLKPMLDALHHFDAASINALSTLAVLSMAVVSVGRHIIKKSNIRFSIAIPLAVGSVAGGLCGSAALNGLLGAAGKSSIATVVQNALLALVVVAIILYMRQKAVLPSFHVHRSIAIIAVGCALGMVSSFLGIGGGPLNVAVIIFAFSMDAKEAAISSLVVILFSQLAKVAHTTFDGGWGALDLSMAPCLIAGAVLGGLLGSKMQSALSNRQIERFFSAVQVLVLAVCLLNIVRGLNGG